MDPTSKTLLSRHLTHFLISYDFLNLIFGFRPIIVCSNHIFNILINIKNGRSEFDDGENISLALFTLPGSLI